MDLEGEGGGSEARKGRKRQMVLESSDSEADEYCISTRQKPDAAATATGNAGVAAGDQSVKEAVPVTVSSEKLLGANSTEGVVSENKGDELQSSSEGASGQGSADQSGEEVVPVSSEILSGLKSTEGDCTKKNKGDGLDRCSAGASGLGNQSGHKVAPISSEKLSGLKSAEGDDSEKNKGDAVNGGSSQPGSKRSKIEDVQAGGVGNGGSVSKNVTGGKMLRRGFPAWRFEKPEIRAGRIEGVEEVEMKASSVSKVKEQVLSLDDKRRHVEPLKHEKRKPSVDSCRQLCGEEIKAKVKERFSSLDDKRRHVEPLRHEKHGPVKTDKGNLVDSGQREIMRVQGKSGLLKILPKNNKVVRETGDGKILSKKVKVDGETGDSKTAPKNAKVLETRDGKIVTKSGVLKLLPKNNKMVREYSDGKFLQKNIKVDGETSDGKISTKTGKVDRESGDDSVPTKNSMVDIKTGAGKNPARNSRVDGETSDGHRRDKEKSSALDESQKQDANGVKSVAGKLVSSIMLRRSDPSVVGVSSGQPMKQQNSKAQLKISSQDNHQPSLSLKDEHKNERKRSLEHKDSPANLSKKAKSMVTDLQEGTSDPTRTKRVMKKPRGGPRIAMKQKLRDQIKGILLDNGWTIDLRPRRSKDYDDSVYVSPKGTGYWSITKAYAVFQKQFKSSHDEKTTARSSKLNNRGAADASFDAISQDDLAMLQRNVRKRKSKKEHFADNKCGDNRSRNMKDASAGRSSRNKYQNNKEKVKIKHRRSALLVRGSTRSMEDMDDYIPYKWKRTVLSWMIDLGVVSKDAKVKYMNKKGTRARLVGRVTREGICCDCCSKILTVAKFELHAGSKEQQPYANIFLEDGGLSLFQCLLNAWDKQAQNEKKGFYKIDPADDPDDDTCGICGDGGDLLCCDRCTSTFHVACLGIEMPSGDWFCRNCICKFCGSAEERTSSPAELLSCLQCSRKYHQVCAQGIEREFVSTTPSASIDCFCSPGCTKIYKRLKRLLGLKNDLEAGFSWSLVRCFADTEATSTKKKAQLVHCNSKTALAFSVLDECFLPRIDERSGINIIHNVVYNCGSDFSRLNFSGFYTFILERGDEVISAATVRIHGTDFAEMPFIGTRGMYRHQGMCHRLLDAIESNTWSTVFGFKPVGPTKKQKIKSVNLLIIHGTGLLEKRLLLTGQVNQQTIATAVNAVECDKMDAQMFGEASGSRTPVHASCESVVGDDLETMDQDNAYAYEGLVSNLPPVPEEKTPERSSPLSKDDVTSCKVEGVVEADNTEVKYAETDGTLIADNIVAEQKPEDKSNSYADSSAIPMIVDPCSSNEPGKGENCTSSEHSVQVVPISNKTESNLNSISSNFDTQEDKKSCAVPANTEVPLVSICQKPDNHELNTAIADGDAQTVIVNARSIDACTTKDQTFVGSITKAIATPEDHSDSAVDIVISTERSSDETKCTESDKSEMKDATIERRIIVESSNEAGITVSALDTSSDICGEVTAKPTLTCGVDGVYKNSMEGLTPKEPANA
ncbi:hypothetical protein BRADI_1g55990v3 [Brachypodium distachyon]|uniref:PHD-type domain-containing protein n=1 Tax=Brachypodium distachyon TaxID=15368 RepID=A0A0Q3K878_BRADI|nr:hypothetical protein BRADI_1g55990v3 [Brachypodium distachyon]